MVLKSVFSSDFFLPLFLPSLGGGSAHDWGGGGERDLMSTVVLVMEQVVNALWRSNKKGEVKEK